MGLEVVNVIEDLDPNWPLGDDPVSQGDDHIRNTKKAVQGSFPNLGPNPVTKTAEEINASGIPTGSMIITAAAGASSGYLLCDGLAVSRTTYADLFAAIGVVYGDGDGATTFNLPDMRDHSPAGSSASNVLGASEGSDTWDANQLPRHTHTMGAGGAHQHQLQSSSFQNTSGNDRVVDSEHDSSDLVATQLDGAHQHIINNTGDSATADNRQKTLYLNYIIKT